MLIIGVAGGTGSGKTTVVKKIAKNLPDGEIAMIPQDSYYKDNSHLPLKERRNINFDHPNAIEWDLLKAHVCALKNGEVVGQPIYSYMTCTRAEETIKIKPKKVIIIEGILCLTDPGLRDMMDLKVFVDADADDRLIRVINRDIVERGRSVNTVLDRYEKTVKPSHLQFIEPTKKHADIIVPQGGENKIAIDILTHFIHRNLNI
ncbi:MAG: uridine kinase [Bacteroidota bacterium]